MTPSPSATTTSASGIEQSLGEVFATAQRVADRVLAIWGKRADGRVHRDDLQALQPTIFAELDAHPHYTGTGFLAEPGALVDAERFLEWWQPGSGRGHERLVLNLDAGSPDVYDYAEMDWYVGAKEGRPSVRGPYLDYAGADRFVLTFAVPVRVGDTFVGAAGVDVLMAAFDPLLFDHVRGGPDRLALVDRDDRVIVSNSPEAAPSERLRRPPRDTVEIGGEGVGWRLCTLDG